jgi:phage shock protein A
MADSSPVPEYIAEAASRDSPPGKNPADLTGMNAADAKEYILQFISTLKLTEKKIQGLDGELTRWNSRIELAKSRGAVDLARDAEGEAEKIRGQQAVLAGEAAELKAQIEKMRLQMPSLAARERSIDPDLLEQELLIAAGRLPGEEKQAETDRLFSKLEKDSSAEAALKALKAKMAHTPGGNL